VGYRSRMDANEKKSSYAARNSALLSLTASVFAMALVTAAEQPPPGASAGAPAGQPAGAPAGPARPGPMAPQSTDAPVTFSKDVAPIVYKHCTTCHRPDTSAPMSLLTYKDARPYAKAMRDHVLDGLMPPWHADPTIGSFANARMLTEAERKTLVAWANTGSREGDAADLPPMPKYSDSWEIGTPDLVVSMQEEFEVPAEGTLEYQWFTAPVTLKEDRWIKAMEVRSTGTSAVHHVVVMEMTPQPIKRQPLVSVAPPFRTPPSRSSPPEGAGGGLLMLTASNTGPHVFREGTSRLLKAGSTITFQVHYTTNGKPTKDRTSIGFVFAKEPPKEEIRLSSFANGSFVIPPGAPNHRIDAELTFVADVKLWSIAPHTHLRGKSFEYALEYPDGRKEVILSVPRYDFEWQTEYEYTQPLRVPKGTKLLATAHYDNSEANRNNPDPKAEVRWGDQTWEEMMFTWVTYSAADAPPPATAPAATRGQQE
jgi:hypothetical protein